MLQYGLDFDLLGIGACHELLDAKALGADILRTGTGQKLLWTGAHLCEKASLGSPTSYRFLAAAAAWLTSGRSQFIANARRLYDRHWTINRRWMFSS